MRLPDDIDVQAEELARDLLTGLPARLAHSAAVAARAGQLVSSVPPRERRLLVAAAWVHDIGYAPPVRREGFHPLDAGLYLEQAGWHPRLCALVAHHSAAHLVAAGMGLGARLDHFPREESAVADALTYADQTIGPDGTQMTVRQRLDDMIRRHGWDSPNGRVHAARTSYIIAAARRVQLRLHHAALHTPAPTRHS